MLTNLLKTLIPGEEGLLAITLPLPYPSVYSMLVILSEGGNLYPSQITKKERNPKQFQSLTEIQERGSLLFVGKATQQQSSGTNKMLSSTFDSTKVVVETRNLKADRTEKESEKQNSLVSTNSCSYG